MRRAKILIGVIAALLTISAFAGTYTVTVNSDSGEGSLREAITLANADQGSSITFNLPIGSETITISSQLPAITCSMDIDGDNNPSSDADIGCNITIKTKPGARFRVFQISPQASDTVNIDNMVIYGGDVSSFTTSMDGWGGAIFATNGNLNLTNVKIFNSKAYRGGAINCGGGRYPGANLILSSCVISGSSAAWSGAINAMNSASLKIYNSSITDNSASKYGGAICTTADTEINYSTISNNSVNGADVYGGGIAIAGAVTSINDSTIANNTANGTTAFGGGIYCESGAAQIVNSTISSNTASGSAPAGGGIYTTQAASLYMLNSILINNSCSTLQGSDISSSGKTFVYYCWVNSISGMISSESDAPNQKSAFVTGDLAPLADNGGSTQTMALNSNCPPFKNGVFAYFNSNDGYYFIDEKGTSHKLIDWDASVNVVDSEKITTDQRGVFRASTPSIGAYELVQGIPPLISKIKPSHSQAGKKVNIFGSNLSGVKNVYFGVNEAKISGKASDAKISVTVPAGRAGESVDVNIVTSIGTMTLFNGFIYRR